jgi:hypothetical protein
MSLQRTIPHDSTSPHPNSHIDERIYWTPSRIMQEENGTGTWDMSKENLKTWCCKGLHTNIAMKGV